MKTVHCLLPPPAPNAAQNQLTPTARGDLRNRDFPSSDSTLEVLPWLEPKPDSDSDTAEFRVTVPSKDYKITDFIIIVHSVDEDIDILKRRKSNHSRNISARGMLVWLHVTGVDVGQPVVVVVLLLLCRGVVDDDVVAAVEELDHELDNGWVGGREVEAGSSIS
ncbi:hypothetical protein EJ04DRAFT_525415 [Polyplosphaeria fusca]|uniref:Uncharacterized protein n=1 Tax=Polyplosphaeria fusca TaxID=682080 RepID=A0A9P4QW53_9PLEO|nr:hypothetical protein EJ04DRAFT_525415 [Polyplosphaeria fusca]